MLRDDGHCVLKTQRKKNNFEIKNGEISNFVLETTCAKRYQYLILDLFATALKKNRKLFNLPFFSIRFVKG